MTPRSTRVVPQTETRSPARSFTQALDNFYAPARDRRGEQAIQQGAQAFSGILEAKAADVKQERNQGEMTDGIQDAIREQAGQELQGVKGGTLFRQNSKFYMMGLNETRGKAEGAKFKNSIALAYDEWEGKHIDDDGTAFREWMNGQVAQFMGGLGDNQYKIAGALPTVSEVANNFAVQHTAFTSSRLEQESFEAYDEIMSGVFTDLSNGLFEVTTDGKVNTDWDAVVNRIAGEADDMYASDGAKANDRVVDAAIRYANIHNDPDSILALAQAHDKGKLKLSQINRERLANAMDAVEADVAREANSRNAQADAAEKARRKSILNDYSLVLQENPYAPLPRAEEVGDHATFTQMSKLRDTFISAGKVENPSITAGQRIGFEMELSNAGSRSERLGALTDFVSQNPEALTGAELGRYMQEITELDDPSSLINDPIVKEFRGGFRDLLGQFQTSKYDVSKVQMLQTMGKRYFDTYMLRSAGSVDMQDPAAIGKAIDDAEKFAIKQLSQQFPQMMSDSMINGQPNQQAAGGALGVPDALLEEQGRQAEEAASVYNQSIGVENTETPEESSGLELPEEVKAIAETLGISETPESTPEIEPVDPVLEDIEFNDDNVPVQGGVYGEMLNRFTDGKDDRHTVRSATEVMSSDPEFATEVDALGAELGLDPMALMAVMDFESGFDPSIRNIAGSGATGLIQFMPKTARSLGTTTEALSTMSRAQQMPFVRKYFKQFGNRLQGGSVDDIYMAVLWPKAIGKPDGYPIFKKGTIAYTQNKGLDTNGDGTVTKYEAASKVSRKFYGY